MNFGFKPYKIKPIKLEKVKIAKIHQTRVGDRTLTPAQKTKIKKEQGFKCAKCKKKYNSRLLEIHHKKGVAKHKSSYGYDLPVMTMGKKYKPKYDRRSNLEAVCVYCHDKTKKKKKSKKKNLLGIPEFKI